MNRDLQSAVQQVIDEELDPDISCLDARRLLEQKWGLPRDGLLPRKAEFVAAFQQCEPPPLTLSPGERAASWIAYCGCGALLLQFLGAPSFSAWGLISGVGSLAAAAVASNLAQQVFGFLVGAYLKRIKRLPLDPSTFDDEANAWLFPASDEAKRVRRRRACAVDHLVFCAPSLREGIAQVQRLTGVTAAAGGHHPGVGTHNALLSLGGDAYLEIIAADPEQPPPSRRRPFGLDDGAGSSHYPLSAFAVHPSSRVRGASIEGLATAMKLACADPGPILPCSRARTDGTLLQWRFTSAWAARGHQPFVIAWADPERVPARSAPRGCTLVRLLVLTASYDEARVVEALYEEMGLEGLREKVVVRCSADELTYTCRGERAPRQIPVPHGFAGLLAEVETPRKELVVLGLQPA